MRLRLSTFLVFILSLNLAAQDTFSIVAVDEATGEIGSAGASCIDGAAQFGGVILISDIIPGRGAVNGQATVCIPHTNLNNAIQQLEAGFAPQEILDWLYDNDGCGFGGPEERQYGIVDFDGDGAARAAAFTGNMALDYAGQRVGANYAIQGNILLGPEILDSMEMRFLNTEGSLADKLMAAMQGANVPGADSRCLNAGTSSTSAFLQVYKSDDTQGSPFLRLNVMETATGVEPIDSLQVLFDQWITTSTTDLENKKIKVYPNPAQDFIQIENLDGQALMLNILDLDGRIIIEQTINENSSTISLETIRKTGILFYQLIDKEGNIRKNGKLFVK